jgi:hypothetical protein
MEAMTTTPLTLAVSDPNELLLLQQCLAFSRELQTTATRAPDGQVLRLVDNFCNTKGREFLRALMTTTLQSQAQEVEKKGDRPASVPAVADAKTKVGARSRF